MKVWTSEMVNYRIFANGSKFAVPSSFECTFT